MSGIIQVLLTGATVPPAPTLSMYSSVTFTAGNNVNVAIGTYTGTVTSYTSSIASLGFFGGIVYLQSAVSLVYNGSTLNITISNAGGTASGSIPLTINPQTQTFTLTNWSFPVNVAIATFTAPRKNIVSGTSFIGAATLATGSLPPGVSVLVNQGGNGDIIVSGTPTSVGTYDSTWTCDGPYFYTATTGTVTITIT